MLYKFSSDSLCKFDFRFSFRFDFHFDKLTSSSDAAFQSIVFTYNITVKFTGNYCTDHVVCIYIDKLYKYLYSVLYAVYIRVYVYVTLLIYLHIYSIAQVNTLAKKLHLLPNHYVYHQQYQMRFIVL